MTKEEIKATQIKIKNLRALAEEATTWTEKCMIENSIAFLKRDLKYLGGLNERD